MCIFICDEEWCHPSAQSNTQTHDNRTESICCGTHEILQCQPIPVAIPAATYTNITIPITTSIPMGQSPTPTTIQQNRNSPQMMRTSNPRRNRSLRPRQIFRHPNRKPFYLSSRTRTRKKPTRQIHIPQYLINAHDNQMRSNQ